MSRLTTSISVQFSRSVMSDSLQLKNTRPSCPSPTPGASSNSYPSVLPSNHLILCRPLLLLPSIFPSIRVFSNESALHFKWPKYWNFSFNISPSNEYSGLISFRMGWLDLLVSPRDCLDSCPTPQFKSINSLELRVLYGQALTSIHDY